LSALQVADLRTRAVGGETGAAAPALAAPAPAPAALATAAPAIQATTSGDHAASAEDRTIKGKTTFKELAEWGVSEPDIRAVFGGEMGASGVALKDYCAQKGIEFTTVKTALQDLVNAAAP
jgi:hypothetical protein